MEATMLPTTSYTARLDRTLQMLRDRVREQEAVLDELRISASAIETIPSSDAAAHIQQLHYLKGAYESEIPSKPDLPPVDSPIPSLLALRSIDQCITETIECLTQSESDLTMTKRRLEKAQSDLGDSKLIQAELQARLSSLKRELEARTKKSPDEAALERIKVMRKKKADYDQETGRIIIAFNEFLDTYLAPMLAAEELGGPIVGEMMEIEDTVLQTGFNAQGKAKKPKAIDVDKRQRRIDQIWGSGPDSSEERNEKDAAAAEMRELTEELLNLLVEPNTRSSGVYVELRRESAAARFLVRSKVAQFHPRDARRLRLVDFGGELGD